MTLDGSQDGGGHWEMSMSRPWSGAVGGSWRARSSSQVLLHFIYRESDWGRLELGGGDGSLPCAGAYVCDAEGGVGEGEGDGWVDEVVDLRAPEMVLEVQSGNVRGQFLRAGRESRWWVVSPR